MLQNCCTCGSILCKSVGQRKWIKPALRPATFHVNSKEFFGGVFQVLTSTITIARSRLHVSQIKLITTLEENSSANTSAVLKEKRREMFSHTQKNFLPE